MKLKPRHAVGIAGTLFIAVALVLASAGTGRAAAVNCSDFANQAAAQVYFLAHGGPGHDPEGLDGDHDGVACQSLPCPCATSATPVPTPAVTATPVSATPTPTATPAATPTPTAPSDSDSLGTSVTLAKVRRTTNCRLAGPLPDRGCTPGARFSKVTATEVCVAGYSSRVRNVSTSLKNAVYKAYGIRKHFNGRNGEVDHLVSLELGGSNDRANLFPEAASPRPGSHEKDRLENELHARVCSDQLSLRAAQQAIARDWVKAYHTYVAAKPR